MIKKRNIVFVGDSYCSAFEGSSSKMTHAFAQQQSYFLSWLDIAANKLDLNLYCFGFAGRSWWYSRDQLYRHIELDPEFINDTDVMVFVHTDFWRFNSCDYQLGNDLLFKDISEISDFNIGEKTRALKSWTVYLRDSSFQSWAQEQWFHEISRVFGKQEHLKILNFFAFPHSLELNLAMPGTIFTTPLVHISIGETSGTDQEITNMMSTDDRSNHFSVETNKILGLITAESVLDYRPGYKKIQLDQFGLTNPNSIKWPNPGFGTR